MTDKQWMAKIRRIREPVDLLEALRDFQGQFGDPYYRDLEEVLWDQVDYVLTNVKGIPCRPRRK